MNANGFSEDEVKASMDHISWQISRFHKGENQPAVIWRDQTYTYGELITFYDDCINKLRSAGIRAGSSVAVIGDYSPGSISSLLALLELKCILVPLSPDSKDQHSKFYKIAEIDYVVEASQRNDIAVHEMAERRNHPLLQELREANQAGLVLFSSGSSGEPKAILHSLPKLLEKFQKPRYCFRTLSFLLFDHIGGFNTLFYTLANLGCMVVAKDRKVSSVCDAIEKHKVELLPTSPSFLNLLLLTDAAKTYDLQSLKLITYGTEVMPERTLKIANEVFPQAKFQQTYGLTEVGILRSKSAANNSLLVKIGGEDYNTRVVDGRLQIRAKSSMMGYLNAPNPFDADGWFDTGDAVIQEGDYYRILGRQSDIINVGGQKVYPTEVEKVIAELPDVIDVSVKGESHLLLGQTVVCLVQMANPIPAIEMKKRILQHSKGRLQPFMIPAKVRVVTDSLVNYRFKKLRRCI